MRISSLLNISEAATGYNGGGAYDYLPHLSLTEATGYFPSVILEAQMGFNDNKIKTISAMTEAAVNAVQYGGGLDISPIVEASFDGLKTKIKAFFDKIIKWLKSIIAKITLQIDKIRLSGHQLYTKYKNDKRYRGKNYRDMTVEGYRFEKGDDPFPKAADVNVEEMIQSAIPGTEKTPGAFAAKYAGKSWEHDSAEEKEANKTIEAMQDLSHDERVEAYLKFLIGSSFDVSGSTWVADVKKELYGSKVDLKYGTDFSETTISGLLEKPAGLDKIKEAYVKLERAAHKHNDAMQKELNDNEKKITRARSDSANASEADKKAVDNANNVLSMISSYYTEYMKFVSDSYSVINQVQSIATQYQTDRVNQAKSIFGKMLSYNDKKNNNDASFGDSTDGEVEIFDFAL